MLTADIGTTHYWTATYRARWTHDTGAMRRFERGARLARDAAMHWFDRLTGVMSWMGEKLETREALRPGTRGPTERTRHTQDCLTFICTLLLVISAGCSDR